MKEMEVWILSVNNGHENVVRAAQSRQDALRVLALDCLADPDGVALPIDPGEEDTDVISAYYGTEPDVNPDDGSLVWDAPDLGGHIFPTRVLQAPAR